MSYLEFVRAVIYNDYSPFNIPISPTSSSSPLKYRRDNNKTFQNLGELLAGVTNSHKNKLYRSTTNIAASPLNLVPLRTKV